MSSRTIISAEVSLVLAVLAGSASAQVTLVVPKDQPSIQAAIDAAADGDTILVLKGTYLENVVIAGRNDLTLRGKGKVIIEAPNGEGTCLTITGSTQVTVMRLRMQGAALCGIAVSGCDSIDILRCTVSQVGDDGIRVDDSAHGTIDRCKLDEVGQTGIALSEALKGVQTDDFIVSRCKVSRCDVDGISVLGDNNQVLRNRVTATGDDGIETRFSTGTLIERNLVKLTAFDGIDIDGSGNTIQKNRLLRAGESGLDVNGPGNSFIQNKLILSGEDGVLVADPDNTFTKNRAVRSHDDGFDVDSSGNSFERNMAVGSGDDGFAVAGTANSFTADKASGSLGFDLLDDSGGGNTYTDTKFKTQSVA